MKITTKLKKIKSTIIKHSVNIYHTMFKFIVNLKIWNITPWDDVIETKRDDYLIKDYITQLNSSAHHLSVIKNLFNKQLEWHNANKEHTLTKQTGLLLCFNTLKRLTPLFNIIGVQSVINDIKAIFLLQCVKREQGELSVSVEKYFVEPGISLDVGASLIQPVTEHINSLTADIISSQICNNILLKLWGLCSDNITRINFNDTSKNTFTYSNDKCNNIVNQINRLSTNIGERTRRGSGNFIVTSPAGVSLLQISYHFTPIKTPVINNGYLHLMGMINDKIKVYSTLTDFSTNDSIPFLIGYNSNVSTTDTGCVYAIQQLIYPIVNNQNDMSVSVVHDYFTVEPSKDVSVGSKDYYRALLVDINNE
jgi:hypothetical protein